MSDALDLHVAGGALSLGKTYASIGALTANPLMVIGGVALMAFGAKGVKDVVLPSKKK